MMLHDQMLHTVIVVLLTLVGAGVTAQLEAATPFPAARVFTSDQPTVLRDHINFFWVGGGAILGGYVAVALRQISGLHHVVKYFAVSVATALAVTPYVLIAYFGPVVAPEACFILGFLFAVGAWLAWEIVGILAWRLKDAARKRGWIGVKEELLNPIKEDTNKETKI
ncbi:MAG: hypothetical protein QM703_24330 [Gemmatales bacterium]